MTEPLHLTRVKLAYFKAVSEPQTIALRPFNVLVGRNGAGKSTLIEALHWIDTAARHTTDVACDRYRGPSSLVNKLYPEQPPTFGLAIRLAAKSGAIADYACNIEARGQVARIESDEVSIYSPTRTREFARKWSRHGKSDGRRVNPDDRLTLLRLDELLATHNVTIAGLDIVSFWKHAVFLRLDPGALARGAGVRRPSLEPILDEAGAALPFLLEELDADARTDLVDMLRSVLPDVCGVEAFRAGDGRDVDYLLTERGAHGRRDSRIPARMLSEGTRRMTAIFALLAQRPGPSLLCIEEIENGLDQIAARKVLHYLQEASRWGVQVIITTHSPWLLDDVDPEDILVVRRHDGDTTYTPLKDIPAGQTADPHARPGGRYLRLLEA